MKKAASSQGRSFMDPWLETLRGTTNNDPTQKIGVSGTAVYGGFIQTQEKNPKLTGVTKYQTYADIFSNVSIVAAGVRYFLNVITKSAWKVEPADDSKEAARLADLVEDIMHDMETPWHRVVRKSVMYKFYGFAVQEWTAKLRDDGVIGFLDIESRPQKTIERWDVDKDGVVFGCVQRSPQTAEELYIPRKKFIYLVDDSMNDSPEGSGLFRQIAESSHRLQRYEQLEGYGYETDLRGIPIGRAPMAQLQQLVSEGTITLADRDRILKPMKDFIENHIKGPKLGVLLDSLSYVSTNEATTPSNVKEWDIELLKGGSDSLKDIHIAINRVNAEVARILGVEGLLLGGGGRGSQALSRDKSDNFYMVVDSALKELAATMSKDVLNTLWMLNGWDPKMKPLFKTDSIQLRDVDQITQALTQMAQAGALLHPDDPCIDEVRDLLGLSRPGNAGVISSQISLLDNNNRTASNQ